MLFVSFLSEQETGEEQDPKNKKHQGNLGYDSWKIN